MNIKKNKIKPYLKIIRQIEIVRSKNNKNWMDLLRLAFQYAPSEAAVIFSEIFKEDKEVKKDIELLVSQIERCSEILKKLTMNPTIEDDFIDKDLPITGYINEIVKSFQEISKKSFIVNSDQNSNPIEVAKSTEIIYGLRNFIGNANKYSKSKIFINIKTRVL